MRALGKSSISSVLKITLDIVWYLSIAGVVLLVLFLGFSLVTNGNVSGHLSLPVVVNIDPDAYSITAEKYGIASAELEDVSAHLRFRSPGGGFLSFFIFHVAVDIAIVMVVIYLLRRIISTLAAGSPFVPANASRIRAIGWVVIVGEFAKQFVEFLGHIIVTTTFDAQGLSFEFDMEFSLSTIFWGFVLLALAEVFRLGVQMREDQSLTI